MRTFRPLVILLHTCTALTVGNASAQGAESSIQITDQNQVIGLTVPVARLAISLPKSLLQRVLIPNPSGSLSNPRYFQFNDEASGVRLSGWFEPASRFQGVKDSPPAIIDGKPLTHENVAFKKIGSWDVIEYDVTLGAISIANLTAHLVQAGSWVELHLSGNPKQSLIEQRASLAQVIQSIQIQEKQ